MPGPVQRVLKSFHTEVREVILVSILDTLLVEEAGEKMWNKSGEKSLIRREIPKEVENWEIRKI